MPTVLGVRFGREFFIGGAEALQKQGQKNSREKFRNSLAEFAEKFAGNFPTIRQNKIENSTQIRSA